MKIECDFDLGEKCFYLTNKNFKEYYITEGMVYSIEFTKYGKIFIYFCVDGVFKGCDISDVFKTAKEAEEALPRLKDKYMKKRNF